MGRARAVLSLAWMLLVGLGASARADVVTYPVPNLKGASDIERGPDGNLWFTEGSVDKIGRITPDGTLSEFAVPTAGAKPYSITNGFDSTLWFTESGARKIGRVTTSGAVSEYTIPGVADDLAVATDGNLWYVRSGHLGRLSADGTTHEFDLPLVDVPGALRPEIVPGHSGRLWISDPYGQRLFRAQTDGTATPVPIAQVPGQPGGGPASLAVLNYSEDGYETVVYTIAQLGLDGLPRQVGIGQLRQETGALTALPAPDALSAPHGITGGLGVERWFSEPPSLGSAPLPAKLGKSSGGQIDIEYPLQTQAVAFGPGPDFGIWFTGPGVVGRITQDTRSDTLGPLVRPLAPNEGDTSVSTHPSVVALFNQPMDKPATQAAFSLTRTRDGAPVAGTVGWIGNTLVFSPTADLAPGTQYTAKVGAGARNAAGLALQNPTAWKFVTTGGGPTLTYFQPGDGTVERLPGEPVVLAFNRPMDRAATQAAFALRRATDGGTVPGRYAWAYGDQVMVYTPSSLLTPGTLYQVSLSAGARAATGTPLANPTESRFRVTQRPVVAAVSPADRAVGVSRGTLVVAAFSQAMDKPSAQAAFTMVRASDGARVAGTFGWYGNALLFSPSGPLQGGTEYRASVAATAKSAAGALLAAPASWTFATSASTAARTSAAATVRRAARRARNAATSKAVRAARRAAAR